MDVPARLTALFGLTGRTAVVTGGSSGIGLGAAKALAAAGADLVLVARDADRLAAAAEPLAAAGASIRTIAADLATRAGVRQAADRIEEQGAAPDIVLHAAGVNLRPPMAEVDQAVWDATLALNLDAAFLLGRRFAPGMAERGYGRLIAIGSQQGRRAFLNGGAYGVSKAALEALTRSQAEAWSASGVTSNVLVPGFVLTPLNARLQDDPELVAALAACTMVGRNGVVDDFATAVLFLASPASGYVTGQAIHVDGGFSVH